MAISTASRNAILNAVFNNTSYAVATPYVSLHTADPGITGASEVTGGSYVRQLGSFGAAASGAIANDAGVSFTLMPAVTVTHAGIWDAESAGNFIWGGALTASKVVNSGDTFTIPTGDLDVSLT